MRTLGGTRREGEEENGVGRWVGWWVNIIVVVKASWSEGELGIVCELFISSLSFPLYDASLIGLSATQRAGLPGISSARPRLTVFPPAALYPRCSSLATDTRVLTDDAVLSNRRMVQHSRTDPHERVISHRAPV